MKWLVIPNDIVFVDDLTEEPARDEKGVELPPQSFVAYVLSTPLSDPEYFGKNLDALDARNDARQSLLRYRETPDSPPRRAKAGDIWGIESNTHTLLIKCLDRPSLNFVPATAAQLTKFMRAIKNAKDKREDLTPPAKSSVDSEALYGP